MAPGCNSPPTPLHTQTGHKNRLRLGKRLGLLQGCDFSTLVARFFLQLEERSRLLQTKNRSLWPTRIHALYLCLQKMLVVVVVYRARGTFSPAAPGFKLYHNM